MGDGFSRPTPLPPSTPPPTQIKGAELTARGDSFVASIWRVAQSGDNQECRKWESLLEDSPPYPSKFPPPSPPTHALDQLQCVMKSVLWRLCDEECVMRSV